MDLTQITPVILTYNEAPNIARSLQQLRWAKRIVIVDSFSTDDTEHIAHQFPNVSLFKRHFDYHAAQWNYAISQTQIETQWVLALDADYVVRDEVLRELRDLAPASSDSAYRATFRYAIHGRQLRSGVYPPVCILFRPSRCAYSQDGHTQRLQIYEGNITDLRSFLIHDDRKPLPRFLVSQSNYAQLQATELSARSWRDLTWPNRIRKLLVPAPFAVFLHCLIVRQGLLDGNAGLFYAFQRMTAEAILSLKLLEHRLDSFAHR